MNTFTLKITACDRIFYEGECVYLSFPGVDGSLGVMAHHQPMATVVENGEIRFRLTSCFIGTVLSEALYAYLMFVSAETIDRYNDRFEALNNGTMSLAEFLSADSSDEGKS